MGHTQTVQTVTSREFVHNVSAAKRIAAEGNTIIITDRGAPAFALLNIAEYRRLTEPDKNMSELLALHEAADIVLEFDPVRIGARELDT
jgi:PHD/YefM family antitoxin component YafN of YafNO toxin-antitoxin module